MIIGKLPLIERMALMSGNSGSESSIVDGPKLSRVNKVRSYSIIYAMGRLLIRNRLFVLI